MAFSGEFNKKMVTFDGIDIVFDEKGSRFLTIRKTQWVEPDEKPDREKAKLEIRKFTIGKDGEEICGKGVAFLTEDGPHNLVNELIKNGYGGTREILETLSTRENFKETVEHFQDEKVKESGEFFDMRSLLYNNDNEDEEEELEEAE